MKDVTQKECQRDLIYESFRAFYKDANQEGKTLSTSSPVKFKATRSLITRRTFLLRESFKPETKVLANSLLFPPELSWASGYVPLNLEMYSSLLASHSKIIDLTNKGSVTSPRCSFINSLKGAAQEKIVPNPDIMVSSSAYCEAISYMLEELAEDFKVPHLHIGIPQYGNEHSLKKLTSELKEIFAQLCAYNDLSDEEGEKNLRKVMYNSTLARKIYAEIWELRKKHAPLNMGLEPLHWHMQFLPMWGDERMPVIMENLKKEIEDEIEKLKQTPKAGIPVGFFGLIAYSRTDLWDTLQDYGAYMSFEGVNYTGNYELLDLDKFEEYTIDDLLENIAVSLLSVPMRGGDVRQKSDEFMEEARSMGTDGMMVVSHEHCQLLAPRLQEIEHAATSNEMKVVSLSGDCILGMPEGPTNFRLKTFLSSLNGNEAKVTKIRTRHVLPQKENLNMNYWRLGVDFGSGFSKYIVLNKSGEMVTHGIFQSGIDYPSLLDEIKRNTAGDNKCLVAVSGIGGDNPRFKGLVHSQTTEINALIESSRKLFPVEDNLLVVDIGTQDVKILNFKDINEAPWINTNKSCGAGTGLVLVQILERWKQTVPDMTFEKLDKLAMQATRSEVINTTCGIFAVTNVVSALVQSDHKRRCEILRGVYEYVATQAIKLLPRESKESKRIFLTGGIASHNTLRRVFESRGYELLSPPENFHPQYLVALGTALSIQ